MSPGSWGPTMLWSAYSGFSSSSFQAQKSDPNRGHFLDLGGYSQLALDSLGGFWIWPVPFLDHGHFLCFPFVLGPLLV